MPNALPLGRFAQHLLGSGVAMASFSHQKPRSVHEVPNVEELQLVELLFGKLAKPPSSASLQVQTTALGTGSSPVSCLTQPWAPGIRMVAFHGQMDRCPRFQSP